MRELMIIYGIVKTDVEDNIMKTIKIIKTFFIAVVAMVLMMQTVAWIKGNENFFTCEKEEYLNPIEASEIKGKEFKSERCYFYKTVVVETIFPSGFPLVFNKKVDTISNTLHSKLR